MAKTRGAWGVASMDAGIYGTAETRQRALDLAGFATPYTRERCGKLYEYTTVEGSHATVGRVADLLAAGFNMAAE